MSDFQSELPIRSQLPGQVLPDDVIVKLGDGTNPTTQLASVDTHGSLQTRIADASGDVIASQLLATTYWLQVVTPANGPASPGTASTYSVLAGGIYNSTLPTLTTGQQASLQLDSSGRLIIAPLSSSSTVTAVGNLTNNNAAPTSNNIGSLVALAEGTVNPALYTSGDQVLLVTDLAGNTNVDLQYYKGAAVSTTNPIATTISDGTHVITAAISAYGTAPTGTEVMGVNAYITNTPTVTASNFPTTVDTNYGTVGASTIRVAAEVGNATGAADFNNGATGAQTLRVAANLAIGGANVSVTNPVPVTITTATAGTPIQNFTTLTAIAVGGNATATYTVPATHTFSLERVFISAENRIKAIVQNNGTTIFTAFNSSANPNIDLTVTAPPSIAAGNTVTVQVFNIDNGASNAYVTIEGNQIS